MKNEDIILILGIASLISILFMLYTLPATNPDTPNYNDKINLIYGDSNIDVKEDGSFVTIDAQVSKRLVIADEVDEDDVVFNDKDQVRIVDQNGNNITDWKFTDHADENDLDRGNRYKLETTFEISKRSLDDNLSLDNLRLVFRDDMISEYSQYGEINTTSYVFIDGDLKEWDKVQKLQN